MEKAVNKKDYLKKYLSGSEKKKKKKKIISSGALAKSKIIDDDLDLKNMRPIGDDELEIYDLAEDAPQIVGIVDDRPEEMRIMAQYRETKKWKVVTRDFEDVKVSAIGDSDSDHSPQRLSSKRYTDREDSRTSDLCKANKRESSVNSDVSPPRKKTSNISYEERVKQQDDSDASPPRKRRGKKSVSSSDEDLSPPRKRKSSDVDSDATVRRNKKSEREGQKKNYSEKTHHSKMEKSTKPIKNDIHKTQKMVKTLEGKKAGLQNVSDMRKEASELRRKQADSLAQLGDEISGRGATAIVRDKRTGKRRDLKEEARQKREKEAKEAETIEKYAVWGKGMKQIDERAAKMKDDLHEMSKPVARYADDEDLEEMRKNEEREGDPMLEYIRSKRKKEGGGKAKPQYQGSYMPNRYNIKPGYRWDGVDRSNGYEKKWFEERNARKAQEEEAFKWSTEDM